MNRLHPIPPGLWCVPSALVAITGADWESVIHPALNRHGGSNSLTELVVGTSVTAARATLKEMGYGVMAYKHGQHRIKTWAQLSRDRYAGRTFILWTKDHCLAMLDGRVYDSWLPHGPPGEDHPFANTPARADLVYKKTSAV